ncbi:MAG: TetR/AcrR family transcriptional regulator [Nocardioides sp.]|nr:TetR/AcrR family transcriptional regulator [Nocardioides sp.]
MARWEPDARGRLLCAALDLFAERGYDATTTAQIAERAGLTKTTLFRLFPDKREIVFQGQPTLIDLLTEAIEDAPAGVSAHELMATGLRALAGGHPQESRETARTLDPIIAASPELRERAVFKRSAITAAFEQALERRISDKRLAGVLADLAVRAYYAGYQAWAEADDDRALAEHALAELTSHQAATSLLAGQ